jgi:hypothetical protein
VGLEKNKETALKGRQEIVQVTLSFNFRPFGDNCKSKRALANAFSTKNFSFFIENAILDTVKHFI